MCIVSMVYDQYRDRFPPIWPAPQPTPIITEPAWPGTAPLSTEIAELRKLIAEFREAVEMAKKLDALLKQPDCTDPAKATLEERVRRIEEAIGRVAAKT